METKRLSQSNILAKEYIVSALLQLIYTKPLSAISISELCKKAGVSRMTFYRNYNSKEEIFTKHLSGLFNKYKNDTKNQKETGMFCDKTHMIHYFTYLYEYRDFLDGLIHCGFGIYFLQMINDYLLSEWSGKADKYTLTAFSGALFNFFTLWASNSYKDNPEYLAEKLSHIFMKNL